MARKAVQGYTDKSYYDNTKYAGMVASNDPMNEGYFRHLVNFDISDTNQSLTPRQGFLTTTLFHDTAQKEHVSLSEDTVVFFDHISQQHVLYDFKNHKGYLTNLDAYSLSDKLIPVVDRITTIDWDDVLDYLLRENTNVKNIFDSDGIAGDRGLLFSYLRPFIARYCNTQINGAVDSSLIRKTILKLELQIPNTIYYPFYVELYYRKDATTILDVNYPANTLVFSVVDTQQHPTYNPLLRNIASAKSIIPNPMQTFREDGVGHTSIIGDFLYYKNANNDYMINRVYNNVNYDIYPYFDLVPAHYALNLQNAADAAWAYKFDIVSTNIENPIETPGYNPVIFRGRWNTYNGSTNPPTAVFQNSMTGTSDITNVDRSKRHHKGTTHIIHVIPKSITGITLSGVPKVYNPNTFVTLLQNYFQDDPARDDAALALYASWVSILNDTTLTIAEKIRQLSATAQFHVTDLTRAPSTVMYKDMLDNNIGEVHTHRLATIDPTIPFISADDLLEYFRDPRFFDVGVTFKMMPILYLCSLTQEEGHDNVLAISALQETGGNGLGTSITEYNMLNENSNESFIKFIDGKFVITISTDRLQGRNGLTSLANLARLKFFERGYKLIFYMIPYRIADTVGKTGAEGRLISSMWASSTPYVVDVTQPMLYGYDALTVPTIPQLLIQEPKGIQESKQFIMFEEDTLVVWNNNNVYISEPGLHYYFKEDKKFSFNERVVKVLQFKTILLVFTVQHLYAVYRSEMEGKAVDDEGKETVVKTIVWTKQTVLYNLMATDKYADVIQVFNQMVLFYSQEGQMFMIKPNVMIDSETQFTLQYFNKSVNDVLENFDVYINECLDYYNKPERITKDQVHIKALLSINYIKLFYCVPGLITYILIFDIINNRYTAYSTTSFTDIRDKGFVESGEMYTTVHNAKTYFTFPYTEPFINDNMCDMAVYYNFKREGINGIVDTGNLNLNNHLHKRFRDLHVTFKNIGAGNVLFNLETLVDDIITRTFYDNRLEVREITGQTYFISVPSTNQKDLIELVDSNKVSEMASDVFERALNNNLFEERNLVLDFSKQTSSKMLTHRTSILGLGKVLRLRFQFVSKGAYKIQHFGIIYKERRV